MMIRVSRIILVKRADRIIVLGKGTVIESGTHKELYEQNGVYRKLYELQFNG